MLLNSEHLSGHKQSWQKSVALETWRVSPEIWEAVMQQLPSICPPGRGVAVHFGPGIRKVAAKLTWPAYGDGRKRENCSVWKDRIIVASAVDGKLCLRDDKNAAFV